MNKTAIKEKRPKKYYPVSFFILLLFAFTLISLRYVEAGNIGVGTTNPGYKLDVIGTGSFSQPIIVGSPSSASHAATKGYVDSAISSGIGSFWTASGANIYNSNSGNVGIGGTPGKKLDVTGDIRLTGSFYSSVGAGNGLAFLTDGYGAQPIKVGGLTVWDSYSYTAPNGGAIFQNSVGIGTTGPGYALDVYGQVRADRYRGINSLGLNTYATVNPGSNVFLYSQPNDRDAWIFLDSADGSSNWGIYHRQIDSAVSGLPANSIGFVGGGSSTLQSYISLANGDGYFRGTLTAGAFSGAMSGTINAANVSSGQFASNTGGGNFGFPGWVSMSGLSLLSGYNPWQISASYNYSNSDLQFQMNGSEKLRVNGYGQFCVGYDGAGGCTGGSGLIVNGNTGIGTASPGTRLSVDGGGANAISWKNGTTGYTYADSGGSGITNANPYTGGALLYLAGSGFNFYNGSSNNMVLTSSGNLGIGTTNPQKKLDIRGSSNGGTDSIINNDGNDRPGIVVKGSYPEIDIISTTYSNPNHGPTLRFAGYKDSSMNTWNHWVIGTGGNAQNLDFGFSSSSQSNPHYGIANYDRDWGGGAGDTFMRIASNGRVGIGTMNPIAKLHVNGQLSLATGPYTGLLTFGSESGTWLTGLSQYDNGWAELRMWTKSYGSLYFANSYDGSTSTSLPSDGMVLKYNKLGLGGWAVGEVPSEKLHVKGNILATGTVTAGAFSGPYSGTISAANVSAGTFGANTGYGDYHFPGNLYIDSNYGLGIVGAYASTRYQGVFAMGDSYKLPADGSSTGNLYGLAWSHPNAGGVASNLNTHGLLVMENGTFLAAISGSIRARDDIQAPIFYDRNNTAYYSNPDSYSRQWMVSRQRGFDDVEYDYNDTAYYVDPNGSSRYNYLGRNYGYNWTEYDWNDGSYYVDPNQTSLYNDLRANIFYDRQDTAYYLDLNGTSNINRITARTKAAFGENSLFNTPRFDYSSDTRYWNGSMGWGTTDLNTIYSNWGDGFWDSWSSPGNAPGGSSHYVGIQGFHMNHGDGTNAYGWQMAMAGEANNRFFWRSGWPSPRPWVEMIHSGNIGSQSVSNSDMVDSLHARQLAFYQSDRDFPSGTLIESDINYDVSSGDPFLLEITGNSYGNGTPVDVKVQGYIYNGTIINTGTIVNGTGISGLVAINYNGHLSFWFPSQGYWNGYNVFINSSYGGVKTNRLISITHSGKPTTAKEVAFSMNYGSAYNADVLDGYHAGDLRKWDTWQYNHYSGTDGAEYATIFYDTNDSGYRVDPNGTSQLSTAYIVDVRPQYMYDWNDSAYYADFNNTSRFNYLGRNYGWNWTEYDWNDSYYYMDLNNTSRLNTLYATSFIYNSDRNLKDNIKPLDNSLSKILQLQGVSFNWKKDGQASVGLIAQDVEKIFPELVAGKEGEKGVQYGNLVAPLIEAVKEQQKEIESLNDRINILENKLNNK